MFLWGLLVTEENENYYVFDFSFTIYKIHWTRNANEKQGAAGMA